ncbi:MAG: hypothetical protein K9L82_00605 [Chromatiaceae bacterium]|nr:hypothetical protein [Chromatiaceae bacterium]
MLPLSIGIAIAVGFAALAGSTYGFDELLSGSWLLLVVWGLIAGPVLMFVAGSEDRNSSWRRGPKP